MLSEYWFCYCSAATYAIPALPSAQTVSRLGSLQIQSSKLSDAINQYTTHSWRMCFSLPKPLFAVHYRWWQRHTQPQTLCQLDRQVHVTLKSRAGLILSSTGDHAHNPMSMQCCKIYNVNACSEQEVPASSTPTLPFVVTKSSFAPQQCRPSQTSCLA